MRINVVASEDYYPPPFFRLIPLNPYVQQPSVRLIRQTTDGQV